MLHREVGGRAVMARQLRQLIEAATTQPNVTVLVIPRHTPRPGRGPRASRVAQEQSHARRNAGSRCPGRRSALW
ncbi:MAG: Scr1 family TA system antitoxin-like transcriptional regulator [Pseudonocardiaceae bacterium]